VRGVGFLASLSLPCSHIHHRGSVPMSIGLYAPRQERLVGIDSVIVVVKTWRVSSNNANANSRMVRISKRCDSHNRPAATPRSGVVGKKVKVDPQVTKN